MPRLPFLDWMKAIGMFLIVFGHVVGGQVNVVTPPIYHKQWGVALFLFASGYTLARETRPSWRVVVNRLFELVLVGAVFAIGSTIASVATGGRGLLSNFAPLLFGANVLFDQFPANPTTWYIGTYVHLILLWAVFRRALRPTPAILVASACAEVLIRAALWDAAGSYIAYMAVPNWMTVWLLGMYAGQQPERRTIPTWTTALAVLALVLPLAAALMWPFDLGFPFRQFVAAGAWSRVVSSVFVTLLYCGAAWLTFRVTSGWPRVRAVEFLAAQTVFIFVAHMPVYYGLMRLMGSWPRPVRSVPLVLVCYVGLAIVGAIVHRWLRPTELREWVVRRFTADRPMSHAA